MSILTQVNALSAGLTLGLQNPPPQGPMIFQPYIGARLYSAILESTILGGRRGLSFYGVNSFSKLSGPSTFAVAAAFPFTKLENPRTAGWAFGLGGGRTTFTFEPNHYFVPSQQFIEVMIGRTSVEGTSDERSGFGGYFEVSLRDEKPIEHDEMQEILDFYNLTLPEHKRSINIRIGAVSGLGGVGFVVQKPSSWLGYSYHLGISLPFIDTQPTLIHLQSKVFTYCYKPKGLCGMSIDIHHARTAMNRDTFEDIRHQFFLGPWVQWYFSPKYMLGVSNAWVFSRSTKRSVRSNRPLLRANFSIAF